MNTTMSTGANILATGWSTSRTGLFVEVALVEDGDVVADTITDIRVVGYREDPEEPEEPVDLEEIASRVEAITNMAILEATKMLPRTKQR
ncbi:hypothetical protein BGZ92_003039 [Podila epicladia]|nr:hypothetical protein BGZ92_003039 [Podila epicladia]